MAGLRRPAVQGPIYAPLLTDEELADIAIVSGAPGIGFSQAARLSERLQRGEQASPFRGPGLDFEDLRPYQPGDDPRRIDWRITARLGKPFVRVYGETRQAVVWVVADRGPSMRFGTRARIKAAQAGRLAGLILSAADRANDALALSLLDGEAFISQPPRNGRAALHAALEALRAPSPPMRDHSASRWSSLLAELETSLPKGARLWLLSDFIHLTEADERLLERLAARAELRLGLIEDTRERDLPALGRVHLRAGGEAQEIDTSAAPLRAAYARHYTDRLARLEDLARRLRGSLLKAATDDDLPRLAALMAGAD